MKSYSNEISSQDTIDAKLALYQTIANAEAQQVKNQKTFKKIYAFLVGIIVLEVILFVAAVASHIHY